MSTTETVGTFVYVQIPAAPKGIHRWDVPARFAGQIVTRSFGAESRYEAGPGDRFMRISDASPGGETSYWKLDLRRRA